MSRKPGAANAVRTAGRRSGRGALLGAALLACACGSETGTPKAADPTLPLRQRIAVLEARRSFGDGELQRSLQHPDARVRRAAAVALGRIQDPEALEPLLGLFSDPDSSVAEVAVFAAGQLQGLDDAGRHALQAKIMERLDILPMNRAATCIEALGKQGGSETTEKLASFIATGLVAGSGSQARPPLEEGMAALALSRIRGPHAADILSRVGDLADRELPAAWRYGAALGSLPDEKLRPPLLALLQHPHKFGRAAAARALGKRHDRTAVPALQAALADLDWEVRASALLALGEVHDTEAASYCEALAADSQPLVREAALIALDSLGVAPHPALVREALGDSVPAVRLAALRVLARVEKARARDAFEAARRDRVDFVRAEALGVAHLVLGEEEAVRLLLEAHADPEVGVRVQAATALGELQPRPVGARRAAVRRALEGALEDVDFVVAASAAEAIGKLQLAECVPALSAAHERHRSDHNGADVRLAATTAGATLARLSGGRASAALQAYLSQAAQDSDARVTHAAARGLATLAGRPEPPLPVRRARPAGAGRDTTIAIDLGTVRVRLVTRHGAAVLALDGDRFPRTVGNFLRLVDAGFYRDAVFHRVVPAFVIQGGCPRGDGWGDAGWFLPCEYGDLRFDDAGIVGMAHAGKDTGGSQFFITYLPVPRLDGRYTAFGRVETGMDVVERIGRGDRFRIERLPEAGEVPPPTTSADPAPPRARGR